jgi:phospholipid transport system transporter-binding protein
MWKVKNSVERAEIEILSPGELQIKGCMIHTTVGDLLERTNVLLQDEQEWHFNFEFVTRVDSSGIALVLAWMRLAKAKKIHLKFSHLPQPMVDLARVSGVDTLLPIDFHN